jgi:hypothetical protein
MVQLVSGNSRLLGFGVVLDMRSLDFFFAESQSQGSSDSAKVLEQHTERSNRKNIGYGNKNHSCRVDEKVPLQRSFHRASIRAAEFTVSQIAVCSFLREEPISRAAEFPVLIPKGGQIPREPLAFVSRRKCHASRDTNLSENFSVRQDSNQLPLSATRP